VGQQRTSAGIQFEQDVVGVQTRGPFGDQRAERVLTDDLVQSLGLVDGEMRRDAHRRRCCRRCAGMLRHCRHKPAQSSRTGAAGTRRQQAPTIAHAFKRISYGAAVRVWVGELV